MKIKRTSRSPYFFRVLLIILTLFAFISFCNFTFLLFGHGNSLVQKIESEW
jgi:hypothetical protein